MGRPLPLSDLCVYGLAVGFAKVSWAEKTLGFRRSFQNTPKYHEDVKGTAEKDVKLGMFEDSTMSSTHIFFML